MWIHRKNEDILCGYISVCVHYHHFGVLYLLPACENQENRLSRSSQKIGIYIKFRVKEP